MNEWLAAHAARALEEGKAVLVLVERSQWVRDAVEHISRLDAPTENLVVRSGWAPTLGQRFDLVVADADLEPEHRNAWFCRVAPGGRMLDRTDLARVEAQDVDAVIAKVRADWREALDTLGAETASDERAPS